MEFLDATFEVKSIEFKATAEKPGAFKALVAVFGNVDRVDDRILPGAFKGVIEQDPSGPPIVWSHQWDEPPIGKSLSWHEDAEGLWIEGELFVGKNQRADEVHVAMLNDALKSWSFAYAVQDYETVHEEGKAIRNIKSFSAVREAGPCLVGVNPAAHTESVKSLKGGTMTKNLERLVEGVKAYDDIDSWDVYLLTCVVTCLADFVSASQDPAEVEKARGALSIVIALLDGEIADTADDEAKSFDPVRELLADAKKALEQDAPKNDGDGQIMPELADLLLAEEGDPLFDADSVRTGV